MTDNPFKFGELTVVPDRTLPPGEVHLRNDAGQTVAKITGVDVDRDGIAQAYPLPADASPLEVAEAARATTRRDTPTGTIIGRLDPVTQRDEWLALRRTGIGSSDIPILLGLTTAGAYAKSELDLYLDKIGVTTDDESGEAAFWGNMLEDPVARVWADRHDVRVARVGTIAHVDHRWALCDLDRRVFGCPDHDRCALEVKTRSAHKADEWKDGATPDTVEAQTMWQMAVTGLDAVHVAALIGGQRLESRLVVRDDDYVADLLKIGGTFWHDNVLAQVPPEISTLELLVGHLSHLTPEKGVPVDLTDDDVRQVRHLTRIILEAKRAEDAGKEASDELKAIIGADATDILLPDDEGKPEPWWTWRSQAGRRSLDLSAVATALGVTVDQLKAEFYAPGEPYRVLRQGPAVKRLVDE